MSDLPDSDAIATGAATTDDVAPPSVSVDEAAAVDDDKTVDPDAVPEGTELVALRFQNPLKAQEAMLAASRLAGQQRLKIDDAVLVIKHEGGKVQLVQTRDTNPAQGAVSGSWVGMLAGLFVPGGLLIGAALGAAVGGIWAKMRDIGINDDEMKRLGEQLEPGEAALFLLVTDFHRVHVGHELGRFDGTLYASTFDEDCQAWIRDSLAEPYFWD